MLFYLCLDWRNARDWNDGQSPKRNEQKFQLASEVRKLDPPRRASLSRLAPKERRPRDPPFEENFRRRPRHLSSRRLPSGGKVTVPSDSPERAPTASAQGNALELRGSHRLLSSETLHVKRGGSRLHSLRHCGSQSVFRRTFFKAVCALLFATGLYGVPMRRRENAESCHSAGSTVF